MPLWDSDEEYFSKSCSEFHDQKEYDWRKFTISPQAGPEGAVRVNSSILQDMIRKSNVTESALGLQIWFSLNYGENFRNESPCAVDHQIVNEKYTVTTSYDLLKTSHSATFQDIAATFKDRIHLILCTVKIEKSRKGVTIE